MLGEVAGYANDLDSMQQALSKATDILDGLYNNHKETVSPITLASMYHKIASSYMTVRIITLIYPLLLSVDIYLRYLYNILLAINRELSSVDREVANDST